MWGGWKRCLRGCDCWLAWELDLCHGRIFSSLLSPWNICSTQHSHSQSHFKDAATSEQCIDTIWMVHMAESSKVLYIKSLVGRYRDVLICDHSRQASYVSSLAYWTCHLQICSDLPLSLVSFALCVQGTVSDDSQKLQSLQTNRGGLIISPNTSPLERTPKIVWLGFIFHWLPNPDHFHLRFYTQ